MRDLALRRTGDTITHSEAPPSEAQSLHVKTLEISKKVTQVIGEGAFWGGGLGAGLKKIFGNFVGWYFSRNDIGGSAG
jgi:hypothetical protein